MKKATTVFGILSLIGLVACAMALHDIKKDYVSAQVLDNVGITATALPEWTACPLEWKVLTFAAVPTGIFHLLFLATAFKKEPS